jgi:hypothetical protein
VGSPGASLTAPGFEDARLGFNVQGRWIATSSFTPSVCFLILTDLTEADRESDNVNQGSFRHKTRSRRRPRRREHFCTGNQGRKANTGD